MSGRSVSSPSLGEEPSTASPASRGSPEGVRRESAEERTHKKQKLTRSKTACLRCRSHRSRCGAVPPGPCPSCLAHGLECVWPSNEGRRGRGRPRTKSLLRTEDDVTSRRDSTGNVTTTPHDFAQVSQVAVDLDPPGLSTGYGDLQASLDSLPLLDPETSFAWDAQHPFDAAALGSWQQNRGSALPIAPQSTSVAEALHEEPLTLTTIPTFEAHSALSRNTLRHHGATGALAGLERINNVNPSTPVSTYTQTIPLDSRTLPCASIVEHVLDLYFTHFSSRFPFSVRSDIRKDDSSFPFLFHCMGALAARLSDRSDLIASSNSRHLSGAVFYQQAKQQLGQVFGVPSRDTIHGLLLLVEAALGYGSRTEMWMFMGMAVRLSLDSTLHMTKAHFVDITDDDQRRDRLLFWAVLIMDYSLSLVEGRRTSICLDDITLELPREDDVPRHSAHSEEGQLRSPFPFAAEMIMTFGPAIDIFNSQSSQSNGDRAGTICALRAKVAAQYDDLPLDIMWNAANLQKHHRAGQGSMFLFLHLWNHAIQCSRYLYDPGKEVESIYNFGPTGKTDRLTLQSIQAGSWLHCARFVGDMLVLADVIDVNICLTIPSVHHCFFVAGKCFINDLGARLQEQEQEASSQTTAGDSERKQAQISRTLFKAIALENIKAFRQGIAKQAEYWRGIDQVLATLDTLLSALPKPHHNRDIGPVVEKAPGGGAFDLHWTPQAVPSDNSYADTNEYSDSLVAFARNRGPSATGEAIGSADTFAMGWSWLDVARQSPGPIDILQLLGIEG